MRTIEKRPPPASLVRWRQERVAAKDSERLPIDYQELRRSSAIDDVECALFEEQGGICAYTGVSLGGIDGDDRRFHVEHVRPQRHCDPGEDTEYSNMVACWPEPGRSPEPEFGARKKRDWPHPDAERRFVSPLQEDCASRFRFTHSGRIEPRNPDDDAARETIDRLGLAHPKLDAWRKEAIDGTVRPRGAVIDRKRALKRLRALREDCAALDDGRNVRLPEFAFAILQIMGRYAKVDSAT